MVTKFRLDTKQDGSQRDTISRTMQIASTYAGELSIEVLPLDKIELDPENARELTLTIDDARKGIDKADPLYEKKKRDWISLESLARTIKNDQLINPIFVYRFGNMCRLIAGERRTLASIIAGKNEIIARIASERPVGTKLKVLQWVENNERSDLNLAERLSSLEALAEEYFRENKQDSKDDTITTKVLSDLTGMSLTQARRYTLVLKSSAEIKNAISAGKLENIKIAELICLAKTKEHQRELLMAALSGKTFETIQQLKDLLDNDGAIKPQPKRRIKQRKAYIILGKAKPGVVKTIVDALVASKVLDGSLEELIKRHNNAWDNYEDADKIFKKIISHLNKACLQKL